MTRRRRAGRRRAALALMAILAGAGVARAQAPSSPAPDAAVRAITLTPTVLPLGRWPEGLAWDGAALWIAESGAQRIVRLDPAAGRVGDAVRVGRLPVDMAAGADGTVYALVNTDRAVFARTRAGRGAVLAGVAGCPERMALAGGTLLVLTWPDCSSLDSRIVAIDTANGRSRASPALGRDAFGIAAAGGRAWVVHRAGTIDVLDVASLAKIGSVAVAGTTLTIAAGETAVFVGGQDRPDGGAPLVARIDPGTRAVSHRRTLPGEERVTAIAPAGRHVVVAGDKGTLFVLSADDLTPLTRITASGWAGHAAQKLLVVGDKLYLTTHKGVGDNGSLLVIDGWRP